MSDEVLLIKFPPPIEQPAVPMWEVICVVSRHRGEDEKAARKIFGEYVAKSDQGWGSLGHEPVSLLHNGVIIEKHVWAGPKKK